MGLSPELFKRLSRLNRDLVRDKLATGDQADALPARAEAAAPAAGEVVLERLVPGREREAAGGRFYHIRRPAQDFGYAPALADGETQGEPEDFLRRYRRVFLGAGQVGSPDDLHEGLRPLALTDPGRVTYLDIETCGLAGEPLFLVGLMRWEDETLRVEQFLARDYAEERPLLAGLRETLAGTGCLVTFNGKTFDVPSIEARCMACGLFDAPRFPQHVDLLFEARRRWKGLLPNCRLQTLEEMICGHRRSGDIPGHEIPAAYHEFVRSRRADDPVRRVRSLRRLQTIMHHNALDLVAMADLATHLLGGSA